MAEVIERGDGQRRYQQQAIAGELRLLAAELPGAGGLPEITGKCSVHRARGRPLRIASGLAA